MLIMELKRDPPQNLPCTLGVLTVQGTRFQTMERPWIPSSTGGLSGEKFTSCVAPGLYRIERFQRPSGEKAFILSNPELDVFQLPRDVPASKKGKTRELVLIHTANYVHDVIGCIGPGLDRYYDGKEWMVTRSRDAMNEIRQLVGTDLDIKLRIE